MSRPVAFVLAGGGSLGAVQAGMLRALSAAGVVPDLVVGSSVGALNGALFAASPDALGAARLEAVWRGLRRQDVFPVSPLRAIAGGLGRGGALCSSAGLAGVVDRHLHLDDLADSHVPLLVVATDLADGSEVVLHRGPARAALLASAAVPGLLPAVVVEGRTLVDGAVSDNAPVRAAVRAGAGEVWVLPSGFPCALAALPRSALGVALQATTLLIGRRLREDLATDHGVPVHLVPPLCPVSVAPHDFSRTVELLERAAATTAAWLARGTPPGSDRLLTTHRHDRSR